jgi:hypothetical protein
LDVELCHPGPAAPNLSPLETRHGNQFLKSLTIGWRDDHGKIVNLLVFLDLLCEELHLRPRHPNRDDHNVRQCTNTRADGPYPDAGFLLRQTFDAGFLTTSDSKGNSDTLDLGSDSYRTSRCRVSRENACLLIFSQKAGSVLCPCSDDRRPSAATPRACKRFLSAVAFIKKQMIQSFPFTA